MSDRHPVARMHCARDASEFTGPAPEPFIFWFDVIELSRAGVVRRTWRIRFVPIRVDQFENGDIISAQDLILESHKMQIDVLTQQISVPGQLTFLYGQKITVRSDLAGVFEEAPPP